MTEGSFDGVGGLKIFTREWLPPEKPRGVVVIVHGFNSHSGQYNWVAEQLLSTGIRIRGLALFCGLAGLYFGSWLWAVGGWASGPTVAGQGIVPLFAGALAVSGFFKLLALGASGPRW